MVYRINNQRGKEVARLRTEDCVVKEAPGAFQRFVGEHITKLLRYIEEKGLAWTVVS